MKFIVERSKWRCGGEEKYGKGYGKTLMLNKDGYMCCLGHCQRQLTPKANMLNSGMPRIVIEKNKLSINNNPFVIEGNFKIHNSQLASNAATINDNESINQKERERQLKFLFKKFGHTIKFVGKTVKFS